MILTIKCTDNSSVNSLINNYYCTNRHNYYTFQYMIVNYIQYKLDKSMQKQFIISFIIETNDI